MFGLGVEDPVYRLDVAGAVNAEMLCLAEDCRTTWPEPPVIETPEPVLVFDNCRSIDIYNKNCNDTPGCSVNGNRVIFNPSPGWIVVGFNFNSSDYGDSFKVCQLSLQLD